MKNFTAALLSFYESIVSNSTQPKAVKNSEVESIHNNRTNLFKNISTRNFLWGFYGVLSNLFKSLGGRIMSVRKGFDNSEKYHDYLNLIAGSRVYPNIGKVSITSRSLIGVFVALLTLNSNIANAQCTGTSVAGTVFRDFNLNGVKDNANEIGLAGVTVKAFNASNAQVGTTTTIANGTYSMTGLSGNVRVEFSGLPTDYVSGPDGSTSGTSVQFPSGGCNAVNYGVNHPDDFCAKSGVQPKVAVPCYMNGAYTSPDAIGEDALVSFAYNKTGNNATAGNEPFKLSKYDKIGSVWGMAYNKFNKTLFSTAFMKRHTGFGPKGIAGLYVIQNADNDGTGYVITGINLETIPGLSTGFAGTEPPRNFSATKTLPTDDGGNAVFNAVGKMSFGDCELSTDGNTLYITNLFDKKIYVLNVTNPTSPTLITSYPVPNPACAVGGEYAPFGLKFYRGKLYVGVICTAESSQPSSVGSLYGQAGFDVTSLSSANLKATVYELNGSTFTTALTQFSLNYDRGFSNSSEVSYAIWRPWVNNYSQVYGDIAETYPQPILSDIEFDSDGSMILGFADRFSHQLGNANFPPQDGDLSTMIPNGDFTSGNTGFSSDYGTSYTVNNTSSTFTGGISACTGRGGSGNFLMGNGPAAANSRVWYRTVNVYKDNTFHLSFWATAINPNNLPQLYFTVNGVRVGADFAAITSTTCNWVKYSVSWYSGTVDIASAVFAIVNGNTSASSGGSGNDFGIDDIRISDPGTVTGRVEGDVMRATKSGSTWTIENNGTAGGITTAGAGKKGGPGGGEYYFGDLTIDHDEPTMGGLALYPGTGEIMTTIAGPASIFYSGGTRRMNNNTGDYLYSGVSSPFWNTVANYRLAYGGRPAPTGDYKLYNGDTPGTFGKASGLGDIEVFCSLAPLEIGNRIWRDYNRNGIQDAGEPGIPLITVLLFKGSSQIATATTDSDGEYYFNDGNVTDGSLLGLLPNTAYEIKVATNQVGNTFLSPTNANSNNSDNIDNDASLISGNAVIALTTGGYGESNHTYDIGFSPNCPTFANPQPNSGTVAICSGTAANLTLAVSNVGSQPLAPTTPATTIQFVSFASVPTNPYSGGTALTTATLADGTISASVNLPVNSTASPITYYVYAILNPTPDANNPNCRPSVAYIVTVSPNPATPTGITGGGAFCKTAANPSFPLKASCAINTTPIWYASQSATVNFFIGDTYNVTTAGTYTYYVSCKGTTAPNCETLPANRRAVSITVTDTPNAPTISLASGSSTNYCGSGSATLNATACATGTLIWSTGSTASSITVTATSTPTTYTATCVLSGCASNASNGIAISTSTVPATPTINGGNLSVCKDAPTSLTATGCSGTYTWSNGGTGATITVLNNAPGFVNYTVKCTIGNCTSDASAGVGITVNPNPVAPLASNVQGGAVCESGVVNLTAKCGVNETPQWYNGNAVNSSFIVAGTAYSPSITQNTTYYVSCKTSAGCESPATNRTPVVGTVNANPVAPASNNVTPASRCEAGTVVLKATCLTNETPQWYNGNVAASTFLYAGTAYTTNTISATTTYYVGCKSTVGPTFCETPANQRTSATATINPNLPAPAIGQTTPGSVCFTGTVTLGASCSTGQTVQWYNNNTTVGTPLATGNSFTTPSISVSTPYYVACRDNNTGCETLHADRRSVLATVNPYPLNPSDGKAGDGSICVNETVSLTATCSTNEVAQWYDSNNVLIPSSAWSFTPTSPTTYNYTVGCKNSLTTCETPQNLRKSVVLVVNPNPVAPLASNVQGGAVCESGVVNLTAK